MGHRFISSQEIDDEIKRIEIKEAAKIEKIRRDREKEREKNRKENEYLFEEYQKYSKEFFIQPHFFWPVFGILVWGIMIYTHGPIRPDHGVIDHAEHTFFPSMLITSAVIFICPGIYHFIDFILSYLFSSKHKTE